MISSQPPGHVTLSAARANLLSIVVVVPLTIVYYLCYSVFYGMHIPLNGLLFFYEHYLISLLVLAGGIILHELLHAAGWMWAAKLPARSMKFGFNLRGLAPYAHCREAMPVSAYRMGTLLPGLALGLLPFIAGLILNNLPAMAFGFIFSAAAAGDVLMLWLIRDIAEGSKVKDHPEKVGCQVVQ